MDSNIFFYGVESDWNVNKVSDPTWILIGIQILIGTSETKRFARSRIFRFGLSHDILSKRQRKGREGRTPYSSNFNDEMLLELLLTSIRIRIELWRRYMGSGSF